MITSYYRSLYRAGRYCFADNPLQQRLHEEINGGINDIILQKRQAKAMLKQAMKDSQMQVSQEKVREILELTLFMKHDSWKSQYLCAQMCYQGIGFKRISEPGRLEFFSGLLNLMDKKEEERWPTVRLFLALDKVIVTGFSQANTFLRSNGLYQKSIKTGTIEINTIEEYINSSVVPPLQSLFWHPMLTVQSVFHTSTESRIVRNPNMIFGIIKVNLKNLLRAVPRNFLKMFKHRQRYLSSKEDLTKALDELSTHYLSKSRLFGGEQPNHIDFYLYSILKTKAGSRDFLKYLEERGNLARWWLTMEILCNHNPNRVTYL